MISPGEAATDNPGMNSSPLMIPPNRLGQLLSEKRICSGTDLEALAAESDFTVGELADIEAGHRLLTHETITDVLDLYPVDCGPVLPQRARLVIDLNEHSLRVAEQEIDFDEATNSHILERYLSLVYVLRDIEPGTEIPIRGEDLTVLSEALHLDESVIVEELQRAMRPDVKPVRDLVGWFKEQVLSLIHI